MNNLKKYTKTLKEYSGDESSKLKKNHLINEQPMITAELYPWKLEINGDVCRLLATDGKPVVTYVKDSKTNTLNVLFDNQNIDFDDLRDACCKCAGESFSCTIECQSIHDLAACVHRFIWLTADGYAVPQTNLIGMDLTDVERTIAQGKTGIYRTSLVDPSDIEACSADLLRSVLAVKPDAVSFILRCEIDTMQQVSRIYDGLGHIANTMNLLFTADYCVPGKDDPIRLDIWAF